MELEKAIFKRRSIRKYLDKEVDDETITSLLKSAMSAPSACNKTPWEFYVVKNKNVKSALENPEFFRTIPSPLKIVVCGNRNYFLFSEDTMWTADVSAAIENMLLRITDLGLGACWCGIYPREARMAKVSEIMSLPENIIPYAIICIGYPDEEKEGRSQYDENKIHYLL